MTTLRNRSTVQHVQINDRKGVMNIIIVSLLHRQLQPLTVFRDLNIYYLAFNGFNLNIETQISTII